MTIKIGDKITTHQKEQEQVSRDVASFLENGGVVTKVGKTEPVKKPLSYNLNFKSEKNKDE